MSFAQSPRHFASTAAQLEPSMKLMTGGPAFPVDWQMHFPITVPGPPLELADEPEPSSGSFPHPASARQASMIHLMT